MLEQYKRIVMIGDGVTGRSVCRVFSEHGRDIDLVTTQDESDWIALSDMVYGSQIDLVVVSPGVCIHPFLEQFRASGIRVVTDIELFCELVDKPIIAVTGTNGKTTCVNWLGRVLQHFGQAAIVGNTGTPVFDIYDQLDQYDWVVIEVSSFQLYHSSSLNIKLGCILNLEADHLDWHPDIEHYHLSKWRIAKHADKMLVHESMSKVTNAHVFGFEVDHSVVEVSTQNNLWQSISHVDQLNCLAVYKMAQLLGLDCDINLVLENTPRLKHRMERIQSKDDWVWFNDSKATNFAAVKSCLSAINHAYPNHHVIWLVGGVFKEAVPKHLTSHADSIIGFGRDGALVTGNHYSKLADLLDALYHMWLDNSERPTVVCFSPGGASFDQFKNYQERGDYFTEWVNKVVDSAYS